MDIAYIHRFNSFPPISGGAVHVHQLISNFIKKGHTVHCSDYESNPNIVKHPRTRNGMMGLCKDVDVLYIRIDGRYYNEKINMYKFINSSGIPIVWEVNSPLEEWLALNPNRHTLLRKILLENKMLKRKLLARFTNSAVCVSKEMQNYSLNFLKINNSYVVPNGSDPEMFTPHKRDKSLFADYEDYFKILWAGSPQYPWQGLDIIQKLSRKLLDSKIIFIIISNRNELKYKFSDNTVIIDEVPYLEIPKYFASVDAALCLYHDFKWSKWGFHFSPLKLFDYMSSGIPVIASSLGQIKEVIKPYHNGLLTNNDVSDITKKILYLKDNPKEAKKIGDNARQTIINFYNWERAADDILRIMERTV